MVILMYIEVTILIDLLMNYLILNSVAIILDRETNLKKIYLSSVIGLIPLIFIVLDINKIYILFIEIIFAFTMAITAFNYKNIIYTIKNILYMYFVSIFLAGSLYLLNIHINSENNTLTILILLVLSPIITKIYIGNLKRIKNNNTNYYYVDIYLKGTPTISLLAYLDTGNMLKDPYCQMPIMLIKKELIKQPPKNIILVPYNTIDGKGMIECFKPVKIIINKQKIVTKVLLGLIDNISIDECSAIVSTYLVEGIK